MVAKATMAGTLVMAPKSVTFRRHDHLVSVVFGDLLSHSYKFCILSTLCFLQLACESFKESNDTPSHVFYIGTSMHDALHKK